MQWGQDRRSLESPGTADAHQLPGASGSLAVKCFAMDRSNLTTLLKMDSMSALTLHQQAGGNDIPTTESPSQRAVAVVHGEEHPLESPTPMGCTQHHSRQRVQGHEGQVRLEVESNHLPTDQPKTGTPGGGSVCQQTDPSTVGQCQLETRSNGTDNQCFHNELGSDKRL